jgi:hypothetical protein
LNISFPLSLVHPPINFYVPAPYWPASLPASSDEPWPGFANGLYAWTVQTYLRLRAAGVPCQLVDTLPEAGIVLIHRNGFRHHPQGIVCRRDRLVVCFQGDLPPHPSAQVHLVQNPAAANPKWGCYFVPHWPQPGLIPRDPQRGDRLEHLAFMGHRHNLAPEFQTLDWRQMCEDLDLTWQVQASQHRWDQPQTPGVNWHDYRTVDAIVAVRSFDPKDYRRTQGFRHKPPTKLYNAWLAGVPAILGVESSYRQVGQPGQDYIEVNSLEEVRAALVRLRTDGLWRQSLVDRAQHRAQTLTSTTLTETWQRLIHDTLVPCYDQWQRCNTWSQPWTQWLQRGWVIWERATNRYLQWRYGSSLSFLRP